MFKGVINVKGKLALFAISKKQSVVVFNEPIFVTRLRINLFTPLFKVFSMGKVKFFNKRSIVLIKNSSIETTQDYCFYINTDKIKDGVKVEAYKCTDAISLANNNELFYHNLNNSVVHLKSGLCVGFDNNNDLALKTCDNVNPAFRLKFFDDELKFLNFENKCIAIDNTQNKSSNFITDHTDILVTTQADDMSYRKQNIKCKYSFNLSNRRKFLEFYARTEEGDYSNTFRS
jgi:hypothetical protein